MNRTILVGLAAAVTMAAAVVPASAGVKFYFGAPAYSGYAPYYPPVYQPYYPPVYYSCTWVVVGYKTVCNSYGQCWKKPKKQKICN